MARSCLTAATAVAVLCLGHASLAADHHFKMVCGKVNGIGAPADVHNTSQAYGFSLNAGTVKDYDPGAKPHDWNLGIMRGDDANGLMLTVASAFGSGSNVTIWYRPNPKGPPLPDTAACIMAQRDAACPGSMDDKEFDKCIATSAK